MCLKDGSPGLIDLHTHLTYPLAETDFGVGMSEADAALRGVEKLRYFLESGITSVRDVGSQGTCRSVERMGAGKSHTGAARVSGWGVHHGGRRALHGKYSG